MALSNAERQRRYIARLKEKTGVTNEAVTNEFMRLKAFAGQLEHENATLKEKLAAVTRGLSNNGTELLSKVSRLPQHFDAFPGLNRTNRPKPD